MSQNHLNYADREGLLKHRTNDPQIINGFHFPKEGRALTVGQARSDRELQIKFALTDTGLMSVLRGLSSSDTPSRSTLISVSDGTREASTATQAKESNQERPEIVARFSTRHGSITLSGSLHDRFPISFILKPGSRTYQNLLQFMFRELTAVGAATQGILREASLSRAAQDALDGITAYLGVKLQELQNETSQNIADLNEIVEIFGRDLEPRRERASPQVTKLKALPGGQARDRTVVLSSFDLPTERHFRIVGEGADEARVMSGFLSLEIDEVSPVPSGDSDALFDELIREFHFLGELQVNVDAERARLTVPFAVSPKISRDVELFLHWGSYDGEEDWVDVEVQPHEIRSRVIDQTGVASDFGGQYYAEKTLVCTRPGRYGVTAYARRSGSRKRLWLGDFQISDSPFEITAVAEPSAQDLSRKRFVAEARAKGAILNNLDDFDRFTRTIGRLSRNTKAGSTHGPIRGIERLLHEVTGSDRSLRKLVSEYYGTAALQSLRSSGDPTRPKVRSTLATLQNIGIGEIVMISPEGPHAIAGGIAQVIAGLTDSLSRRGLSVTVIAPLYEEEQGNKHRSAEQLIADGFPFAGGNVQLVEVGEVPIHFGPVYLSGTSQISQPRRLSSARVYRAEAGNVRVFLLRHSRLADRLYAPVAADEQLRRAIFLSRGALEILRDEKFELAPNIIVSNDWMAGPVPLLLKADPTYAEDPVLSRAKSVHVIHNCGAAYQGRFYANQHGEDLWPIFGLSCEHYFGIADPNDKDQINLTAGAVYHTTGAVLTVSRPYAEQLLTAQGADGLERLMQSKRHMLFGISNGIDLPTLRRVFWKVGENARAESQLAPLLADRVSDRKILKNLPAYKQAAKLLVQRRYELQQDGDKVLISFVGRLAEQKGIALLTEVVPGEGVTPLESILRKNERVQILIGGPICFGDPAVERLRILSAELSERFPGRFRAIFDFILHRDAMEITAGSDLFLMPSRYEPGGITQLEALSVGTLVVARNVGGIRATLLDYRDVGSELNKEGNSFLFDDYTPRAFRDVMARAIEVIRQPKKHKRLMHRAALAEHGWEHRLPCYLALFQFVAGVLGTANAYPHLEGTERVLREIRPA